MQKLYLIMTCALCFMVLGCAPKNSDTSQTEYSSSSSSSYEGGGAYESESTEVDEDTCPYGIKEGKCDDVVEAAKSEISMAGYECSTVTTVEPFFTSDGYTINCNNYQYSYYLKDKGGNWVVELAE